ncbi:tyrosine-type recombinase/integrase [Corallincola platygyrae]|uniref:Tyrosine-type recombinase/integrase n=1 Tax=Corallincola platygyrae TaxID=1193278 RepID=A0ABW4XQ74_9GAMM
MASYTIEKRVNTAGNPRYRAKVREKKNGKLIRSFSRSFSTKQFALTWAKKMIQQIETGEIDRPKAKGTLGQLIGKYRAHAGLGAQAGRTKRYVQKALQESEIAEVPLAALTETDVITHCEFRRAEGAKPQTIAQDVSYLRSVLKAAQPVFGLPVSDEAVVKSYDSLKRMHLIAPSNQRQRRPTSAEISALETKLAERERHHSSSIPHSDLLNFSILTCMRIGETCRIEWQDVDYENRTVMIRDRKDPKKKQGNHMRIPLLGDAWNLLTKQPRTSKRIFPHNPKSVGSAWQRVCKKLGIEDLHYHDLRAEGISRLLEAGYSVLEVAMVSGHRDLNVLHRVYARLKPEDLHHKHPQNKS